MTSQIISSSRGKGAIAIITARGGSKRIPRKNIKNFLGKPIMAYSIEAALKAELFEEVMVSTDDAEIAEIALKYGAKVPFLRSPETANDFATTAEVLTEVLNKYQALRRNFQHACCLYPTAPFITSNLLKEACNLLINNDLDAVFPVQKFSFPIQRALFFEVNKLNWVQPENANVRSQDLQTTYHDAGQFYFFDVAQFLKNKTLLSSNTSGIVISEMEAHDIDTLEDWQIAEFKFKLRNENL